jgi:hypothetical protein
MARVVMTRGNGAFGLCCRPLLLLAAGCGERDAGAPSPMIVLGAGLAGILAA